MLCSAHSDPRIVRELTTLAGDLGGLPMVPAPYVSEITDGQIVDFFAEVAPLSKTGILIYNAPGIGITLSPALLEELSDLPGMVGIKQGDLNPTTIDRIACRLAGKLRLSCASDLAFLGPMMLGFDGISSKSGRRRHRELHRPGPHPYRAGRPARRRRGRPAGQDGGRDRYCLARDDPGRAIWKTRGIRRFRLLPCLGPGGLHHRQHVAGRWRHDPRPLTTARPTGETR